MYQKTTSSFFNEFGVITSRNSSRIGFELNVAGNTVKEMFVLDQPLILCVKHGIAIVVCSKSINETPKMFVIHAETQINAGVMFNFISITKDALLTTSIDMNKIKPTIDLLQPCVYEKIVPTFRVNEIYSYYHQTKPPLYEFEGEMSTFWELTYVDGGSLEVVIENEVHNLDPFDLIISRPNQFISQRVTSKRPCTYLTIIFELEGTIPNQLDNHVFKYNYQIRDIINEFIRKTNTDATSDASDILIANLMLLISKLTSVEFDSAVRRSNKSLQHRSFENKLLQDITKYIEQNIYSPLSIDDICRQFGISRTTLQNLFQSELSLSPKLYINNMRLDMSKVLLREAKYTISEISSFLGFSSIQYFSKKFRQRFKISPREYTKSNYN